jgi:hypothetical protein
MATGQPAWSPADEQTADLLDLIADDGSAVPSKAEEWALYVRCLRDITTGARTFGTDPVINPNVRPPMICWRSGRAGWRAGHPHSDQHAVEDSMTSLTDTRDHARKMAAAEHKPECVLRVAFPSRTVHDVEGNRWTASMPWPAKCPGCTTPAERELWAAIADEIDGQGGRAVRQCDVDD